MPRTRTHRLLRAPDAIIILTAALIQLGAADPLSADVEVLVHGGVRTILARGGDPLQGGGTLRDKFDKVYWVPGVFNDQGYLFLNHEIATPGGGLSRLSYGNGTITQRINWVTGTHFNCSGILTPWRTILSCEEHPPDTTLTVGHVLEVSITQPEVYWRREALGRFSHEGVIEDPVTGDIYMTDDSYYGVFFKFVPVERGDLSAGELYALRETTRDWVLVTDMVHTEQQALSLGATYHPRPEDLVYNPVDDAIYISVTGNYNNPDQRLGYILRFDPRVNYMERWLECDGDVLANPDNLEVDSYGNLLVHEDQYPGNVAAYGPNELLLVRPDLEIMPVLRGLDPYGEVTGMDWGDSEWRFYINWMSGANGSELLQIDCPAGWNRPVGVEPAPLPPVAELRLAVEPNPFMDRARLHAELPGFAHTAGDRVSLRIYDARGVLWRTLLDGPLSGSRIDAVWDGRDAGSRPAPRGTYFARLSTPERTIAEKLLLLR